MHLKKQIGKRIKEIRAQRKISQEKLSEMADIAQNTLSGIETGASFFTAETLEKISNALNIKPAELFEFEHYKTNDKLIAEINKILLQNPEKIKEIYKVVNAIVN